jgi:hypothetical protein
MGSCMLKEKIKKIPKIEKPEIDDFFEMSEWEGIINNNSQVKDTKV